MMISDRVVETREVMQHLLQSGKRRAQQVGSPVLVSLTLPVHPVDPINVFDRGNLLASDRVYWDVPGDGFALAGVGAAHVITATGAGRFAHARDEWRALLEGALISNPGGPPGTGPVVLGGFSFDPLRPHSEIWDGYPDAALILPRLLLTQSSEQSWLTLNAVLGAESDPEREADFLERARIHLLSEPPGIQEAPTRPHDGLVIEDAPPAEKWMAAVGSIADEIRRGELEKVVLARRVSVRSAGAFSAAPALRELRQRYPGCYLFAVARGERCFLGATPERLVRLQAGVVQATCLAGSTARGRTAQDDDRLGRLLLASEKNRAEHAVVVHALRDALSPVCVNVMAASEPVLLKLPNVQHLYTPVTGRLRENHMLLDVVERVHPTPAVGGFPLERALSMIRGREEFDRGWYAGPVGWLDPTGEGEFAVAIRSALIKGEEASLFAGCGIVAGSDPICEYEESCLKLKPMLSALQASAAEAVRS